MFQEIVCENFQNIVLALMFWLYFEAELNCDKNVDDVLAAVVDNVVEHDIICEGAFQLIAGQAT